MAFFPNYKSTLSGFDLERYEAKVRVCKNVDPYELPEAECSSDISLWPKISDVDRIDYFVYRMKFCSKESMKALKAIDAHNFFTSGHVSPNLLVKEVSPELVVTLGTVSC